MNKRLIINFVNVGLISCLLVGCSSSDTVDEVIDCSSSTLMYSLVSTTETSCGASNGRIEIKGEGGTGMLQYSINGSPLQSNGVFENLPSGLHFIAVRDELGCKVEDQILLSSGVSLAGDVFDRIGLTCAVTGCHVRGGQAPNFTEKRGILSSGQNIKRRLEDNSMPPLDSGKDPMPDEDKELVICWINDGALDN